LVACFVLVVTLFYYSSTAENRRMRSEFQFRQRPISAAIVREIERATSAVVALASFFRASEVVESDEFETFAQETLDQRPGVRALEWGPLVRRSDRAEAEFKARARGAEGFEITELDGSGTLVRAGDRDQYFPVTYVQPREENARALGYDLASDPIRSTTIRAAIAEGVPTVTERIQLVQDSNTTWSVLILVPVYAHGSRPPATIEERQHRIEGLTIGVLNLTTLVEQAIKRLDDTGLVIEVLDLSAEGDAQRLYGEQAPHPAIDPESLLWSEAGRQWEIRVGSSGPPTRIWSAWYVLAGGLIFTGLFGAFLLELATRQIHIERLVALRTRELARANDELQRSNLELQRFAHVASHDLREPLRTIGSYAQLLDESASELESEHRKLLERVVAAARRMQALVDDLLALSRVEGSAAARVSIPLERLVALALENLKPAIDAAHAHIEVGELPTVTCDSSQIVQLLQNLIANAVKFHREGMAPYITVQGRKVGSTFEIAVKDNGIGIAPEHHEKVFEMFERLHGRERYGGTGIGLAICRRIVDRHGGRIWLESSTEGGSVFRFTLPAEGEWG
jgi:signal transduction histidine kinase